MKCIDCNNCVNGICLLVREGVRCINFSKFREKPKKYENVAEKLTQVKKLQDTEKEVLDKVENTIDPNYIKTGIISIELAEYRDLIAHSTRQACKIIDLERIISDLRRDVGLKCKEVYELESVIKKIGGLR